MAPKILKIFIAEGCDPCKEISELAKAGKMLTNVDQDTDIQIIDILSDEGFPEIAKENLDEIPTAKYDGRTCKFQIDDETKTLIIDCSEEKPKDDQLASPPEKSSHYEVSAGSKPASS